MLDSIVEDRLLAEASQGSEDQKLVEQLNLDKRQLDQLLLQPAQKLSAETNQRIEALEGEAEKIESQLAQHVTGLGQARHALGVRVEQVQSAIPNDGALIEYLRFPNFGIWPKTTPLTCLALARSIPNPRAALRRKSTVCGLNGLPLQNPNDSQRIELRRHDEVIPMKTSNLVGPESNRNSAPLC